MMTLITIITLISGQRTAIRIEAIILGQILESVRFDKTKVMMPNAAPIIAYMNQTIYTSSK